MCFLKKIFFFAFIFVQHVLRRKMIIMTCNVETMLGRSEGRHEVLMAVHWAKPEAFSLRYFWSSGSSVPFPLFHLKRHSQSLPLIICIFGVFLSAPCLNSSQVVFCVPDLLGVGMNALWRLRQENLEFKDSLGYILIPYSQSKKKKMLRYVSTFVP